jgi:hypothetical protein
MSRSGSTVSSRQGSIDTESVDYNYYTFLESNSTTYGKNGQNPNATVAASEYQNYESIAYRGSVAITPREAAPRQPDRTAAASSEYQNYDSAASVALPSRETAPRRLDRTAAASSEYQNYDSAASVALPSRETAPRRLDRTAAASSEYQNYDS